MAQLIMLVVIIITLLDFIGWLIKPHVYGIDQHAQDIKELIFGLLGAIDAKPDAGAGSVAYSVLVRLLGAVVFGGVITSFLCARVNRYADKRKRGLLVPAMRGHFVVVGFGAMTDDLIRAILDPREYEDLSHWVPQERIGRSEWERDVRKRKVLLCTGGDIETIRETLDALLPRRISKRVYYAFGNMNAFSDTNSKQAFAEICERLCLEYARQIYIVGDEAAKSAGDVENLAFAKGVGEYIKAHSSDRSGDVPMPIFVRLDGGSSFDFVKKISFETDPLPKGMERKDLKFKDVTSYFKPFSFTEGWARRIWGEVTSGEVDSGALDFAPMGRKTFVHLVVAGLTPFGEALVLQAARVCHFPNGDRTLITVIDPDDSLENAFDARHPSLRTSLPDVEIEFRHLRLESTAAREFLSTAAMDEQQLLTIAICFRHSDASLSAALNLPEEVYWHRMNGGKKDIRGKYRENGARIWVFQEHRNGLSEQAGNHKRYELLRPFGMQEDGFTPWCIREFAAMYLNAVYDWPNDGEASYLDGCGGHVLADRIAAFREKWKKELAPGNPYGVFDINAKEKKDLLLSILAEGGDVEVRRFQEYAFREYVLLKPELRWANTYVSDSYGTTLRALGLRAVYATDAAFAELAMENDRLFTEARASANLERGLDEAEHYRWMADRALMGYRAPRQGTGEKRDDDFRYHFDMIPFDQLPPDEVGKDELSISCIPLFMALEGIRLERA